MSLDSIKNHVDEIIAVHSTTGWVNTPLKNNCIGKFNEWAHVNHRIDSYHSIVGEYKTQEEQYRAGWDFIQQNFSDAIILLIDTDEIWEEADLIRAKELIAQNPHQAYSCKMRTYIKEPYYLIDPPEQCAPVVFIDASKVRELKGVRGNGIADKYLLPEVYMHHFTYVRKSFEDIKLKFLSSELGDFSPSHKDWLNRVWPVIPNIQDFHTTIGHENSWKSIKVIERGDLPAVIRDSSLVGSLIKKWGK